LGVKDDTTREAISIVQTISLKQDANKKAIAIIYFIYLLLEDSNGMLISEAAANARQDLQIV
jgi:hypothetical protein